MEKPKGEFLSFYVDRANNAMKIDGCSAQFQPIFPRDSIYPVSPLFAALDSMARRGEGCGEGPLLFRIDVVYQGNRALFRPHLSEDYASVVNVPHKKLESVLSFLTPREREIAILLFEGQTIRSIAGQLHIAEGTVKRNIYNTYQRMNICSQVELFQEIYTLLAQEPAEERAISDI
ncbi:MAG: helix-turn-helix transcriptional regulator [Oscillospiraceae bacterium]|nr:helix-turn-helix transcriptional regulator [Oscillospiraceae bacterium]